MYTGTSTEFNNLIQQHGGRTFYPKLECSSFSITSGIKKITYTGGSNAEDGITVGSAVSAYIEVTAEKTEHVIAGQEISVFLGMKINGSVEYVPMGIFKANKPELTDYEMTFKAYDRMTSAEKNYASSLSYPASTTAIMEEIAEMLGIEFVTDISPITLNNPNTGENSSNTVFAGYTIREAIGYIAGLYGKFAVFNRTGQLEFRWYEDNGFEVPVSKCYSFSRNESNYVVNKIIGIAQDGKYEAGTGITGISFSNPFVTQEIVNNIYTDIGGFTYRGGETKFLGDCRIDAWDMITGTDLYGNEYKLPVMEIVHEIDGGLTTTVKSKISEDTDVADTYQGPITKAMERTHTELLLVNQLIATKASIDYLEAHYIKTDELDAVSANIENAVIVNLQGKFASIEYLESNYATIGSLSATNARVGTLEATALTASSAEIQTLTAGVADINTLIFGSASGNTIQTQFSNSVIAQLGDAQIESAMIAELDAGKIKSGSIYTNLVHIYGDENNRLSIVDNTITINDGINTRVQIGKDAAGDYNMYLWDTNGNLMFDALGLTEGGITRPIIRDDVVKDNANISASKLNIDSLFEVMNEDGSHTLKSSKIYVDADGQTLDVSFKNMTTNVSTAVTNANAAVSTANTASSNANTALSTANTAKSTADAAKTTASSASSTANTAKKTADTASSTANTAKETADSALGKANTNTANITNLTTTVSTQGTQITTIQGQISSKIWQQDITKEISQIEIGGRNLQLGSRNWDDSAFYSKGSASISNGELTAVMSNTTVETHFINVNQGDVFTLGIDVKSTNVYTGNTVLIEFFNTSGTRTSYIWVLSDVTTKWKRITNTFTVNDTSASCMRIGLRSSSGYVNTYRLLKIERGNTATDWTPAPEDTETSITTLSTQYNTLDQTINSMSSTIASHTTQIAAKADNSTVTTVSNKVTALEQNLSGFKTTVSSTYATQESLATVDGKFANYSTTTQMNSAISQSASSVKTEVSKTYQPLIFHRTSAGAGSAGYFLMATLKITGTYANTPISLSVMQRGSRQPSTCWIRFTNANTSDPTVSLFYKSGTTANFYLYKSGTGTWQLYMQKGEPYDAAAVTGYSNSIQDKVGLTWETDYVSSLPEGCQAATQMIDGYTLDITSGGTSGSGSLITSGAVYKGISSVTSSIEQLSDEIALTVKETDITGNYLIGKINLTSTTATIAASHINLAGAVTISALATDVTNQINTANTNATTAINTANSASATAGTANATAAQAKSVAESAKTTAANANTAAGNALDTADDAINTATTASTNASTALSTANTAKTNASSALGRATYQYGTCSTAAATASKVVTLSGFTLFTGARISVKFTYANTVASPTLNVNSTGAKTIYAYGAAIAVNSPYSWNAGATVDFIYNGTQWEIAANSANGLIAWWCANNNKTYIDGAKLYAETVTATKIAANAITADKIATDAIKSRNYVAGSTGSYLNLADGSFDSPKLKWDKNGSLTASSADVAGKITGTSGKIGNFIIDGSALHADYYNSSEGRTYRVFLQPCTSATSWGISLQNALGQNPSSFGGAFTVYGSGDAECRGFHARAQITADSYIKCVGTAEILTSGNCSNLILHNDYDRKVYIRYDENFKLNFLPHT